MYVRFLAVVLTLVSFVGCGDQGPNPAASTTSPAIEPVKPSNGAKTPGVPASTGTGQKVLD